MEQVDSETSSCRTLELIRGSKIVSDNSSTVRIQGDCWPPYGEIITKSSLCWSSKLRVEVDYLEGKSALSFGFISPNERNEGQHRLSGKLWAWSSKSRKIFIKPFDSVSNYGRITPLTQFYNKDITSGSDLGVSSWLIASQTLAAFISLSMERMGGSVLATARPRFGMDIFA